MIKTQDNDGVVITTQVEEVVKLTDLDLELERLEGQKYEATIRLGELQNVINGIEAKIQEKTALKAEILSTFPEIEAVVYPVAVEEKL